MGWGVFTSAADAFAGSNKRNFFSRYQTPFAFILFIFLSVIVLEANPFAAQTVAPLDLLLNFPGYAGQRDHKTLPIVQAERNDIIDSQLPEWMTLKDQIRNGESPLWHPNAAGGHPVTLTLSNPAFLLFLSVEDDALAYYFVALAKLIISGFGMYLLLRTHLRWIPSVWGGIVFMLCGFNAAWFFWEQASTAMWIPWLLWATVLYLKTEETKWLPAIAVSSLLLIFGGFPAVAAFGFFAFSLLILVWNIPVFFGGNVREARYDAVRLRLFLKKAGLPLIAVGMAFLMSAVALIPFIDYMSGLDLSYRTGGTAFSAHDLSLLFSYEDPPKVERTAYVGVLAVIFALIGVFSVFRANDKNLRIFILFNALLVMVSLLIAFGLLPHGLIGALPVFKSNTWGRLIVVTLLGLAALSAVGLEFAGIKLQTLSVRYLRLSPLNAQRVIAAAMIGILAVQFYAQKNLFNSFNAVVPSAWFYPMTPSIAYVKERLAPLQSVIADDSYDGCGTLGAYDIPEWYAHSWRTETEKAVLSYLVRNSFVSPTAASIVGSDIQYDSTLMDKLGIKYILVNKNAQFMFVQPELSHLPAPPLPDNALRQHIHLPQDMVIGSFGFKFLKHANKQSPARVRLSLFNGKGKKFPLEPELGLDEIVNNRWVFFKFPDKVPLKEGAYSLVLSLVHPAETDELTVLATQMQNYTGSYLEINGRNSDVTLKYSIIFYENNVPENVVEDWNVISLEKDIMILENKQVTNSAYFIKDLDEANESIDFSGLKIEQVSVRHINIDYSKRDTGWIVLPMRLHPGWKAYINDRRVHYDTYLGMLPAIPVQGTGTVIFKYEPASVLWGVIVSSTGLFIFLIFSWRCVRTVQRRGAV
jgi:hypothetical protein